jgi:hypothetical protein
MESNDPIYPSPPTNRHSITSLILGILTVIVFCGGIIIPIPFTSFICVPVSSLMGLFALIYGAISLNTIRRKNETGGFMAWMGILSGGFIFLCMLCVVIAFVSLFFFAPDTVQPIIEGYQL